ncbi:MULTISPECIES: class II fructose-1,6-bisphosphate aldolase [Bacillaceae]|uniref:6-phospho-5-dehydro-2-deoxy-D-gluconate aldolase n=1 Tax=Alkalicoccobacillus plakortidis TaxID=444060 RepID=A0A9D5DLI5_9BACI|nr:MULTISPECIES: class II fructose-1,6-bisphosphate aldolase [Bacillaceae]KQL56154.1 6-phospho-5-dehydro-2-deoxy-D-gluconate aldolase [Alkalicoccobacillus plakortidis]
MAFAFMKELLVEAKKNRYAIGQFNINGLQWTKAILLAAEEEQSPVIAAASERMIDYLGGYRTVVSFVDSLINELNINVPVVLHLDHGRNVQSCFQAIDAGFSSVMIDGSHLSIEENIAMTKEVSDYAVKFGVSVEAEVGTVGGTEDGVIGGVSYANVDECERLVTEANIDALAAALGSVHGRYHGEPKLGFKEMEQISKVTDIPLVLHGASGIPSHDLERAIQLGHAKVNINTECMIAWSDQLRKQLIKQPDAFEPATLLTPAIHAVQEAVQQKLKEFGSTHKANLVRPKF